MGPAASRVARPRRLGRATIEEPDLVDQPDSATDMVDALSPFRNRSTIDSVGRAPASTYRTWVREPTVGRAEVLALRPEGSPSSTGAVGFHPGHRPGAATVVRLEGVSRRYRVGDAEVYALHDVDLEVDEGEFVVVLGPSGSGKSTLLNIIGALDRPTSGRAVVAGHEITGMSRGDLFAFRRTVVSFVFQTFNLFPTLTAAENVQCGAEIGVPVRQARRRAIEVLEQVGLAGRLHHYPSELSGGEQQRVAIARALATGNPLLVADEPTGDLDFRTGVQILQLLRERAEAGRTVIVVTHNREISRIADRVVELSSGRVASDGPPVGGPAPIADLHW